MSEAVIVAIISLIGTFGGSIVGCISANKIVNYRIQQLEIKVDKHNNLIDRMYKCEEDILLLQKDKDNIEERIEHYHHGE